MNKFIISLNDSGLINLNEVLDELKNNDFEVSNVFKTINVIAGESKKTIDELKALKISGIKEIEHDGPKQMIPPSESDIQ